MGGMSQANENNKELLINLGNKIRKYRQEQNLSQEELAFRIDSARNFIGCIERAEKSPTIITLYRIAQALNITLEALVSEIEP